MKTRENGKDKSAKKEDKGRVNNDEKQIETGENNSS